MAATITGVKTPYKSMVFDLAIDNPPPQLALLINPESFELRFTPKVTESRVRWTDRTESGYILQTHHDELDMISASGKSAMFIDPNKGLVSSKTKTLTAGYINIQQLVAVYKNNGLNFNKKPNLKGSNLIQSVGRVVITYDRFVYFGSFENFTLNESDDKPFNIDFSFDFKVSNIINTKAI